MARDRVYFLRPTRTGLWKIVPVIEHGRYHEARPASWRGPIPTLTQARLQQTCANEQRWPPPRQLAAAVEPAVERDDAERWHVWPTGPGDNCAEVRDENGLLVADMGTRLNDARLIAAAPQMRQLLADVIEVLDAFGIVYGASEVEPLDVLRRARALWEETKS